MGGGEQRNGAGGNGAGNAPGIDLGDAFSRLIPTYPKQMITPQAQGYLQQNLWPNIREGLFGGQNAIPGLLDLLGYKRPQFMQPRAGEQPTIESQYHISPFAIASAGDISTAGRGLEQIRLAAIKYPSGEIKSGATHWDIIGATDPLGAESGFITTLGRFVGREEAHDIAIKSKQLASDPECLRYYGGEAIRQDFESDPSGYIKLQ